MLVSILQSSTPFTNPQYTHPDPSCWISEYISEPARTVFNHRQKTASLRINTWCSSFFISFHQKKRTTIDSISYSCWQTVLQHKKSRLFCHAQQWIIAMSQLKRRTEVTMWNASESIPFMCIGKKIALLSHEPSSLQTSAILDANNYSIALPMMERRRLEIV